MTKKLKMKTKKGLQPGSQIAVQWSKGVAFEKSPLGGYVVEGHKYQVYKYTPDGLRIRCSQYSNWKCGNTGILRNDLFYYIGNYSSTSHTHPPMLISRASMMKEYYMATSSGNTDKVRNDFV